MNISIESYPQYCGMSYEQASREGARLIARAHESGRWVDLVEKLTLLRETMRLMKPATQ